MAGNNIWVVLAFALLGRLTEALERERRIWLGFFLKDKTVGFASEQATPTNPDVDTSLFPLSRLQGKSIPLFHRVPCIRDDA